MRLTDLAFKVREKVEVSALTADTFVSADNMNPNFSGVRVAEKLPPSGKATAFQEGDILFSKIRPYLNKVWRARYGGGCSQDVLVLRPYNKELSWFIFGVLARESFSEYVMSSVKGTRMPRADEETIFSFPLPDLDYASVGKIVQAFSELELILEAEIQELEDTAQEIYNYWFVQYEFPDENGNPYRSSGGAMVWNETLKRDIPEGWSAHSLYAIADFTNGLACQKHRPDADDPGLPVIKIKEMTDGISIKTERVSSLIPTKYLVSLGDILFSWSATLIVQRWDSVDAGLNQHIFKVKPVPEVGDGYLYLLLEQVVGEFVAIAMARKTTMGHITQDHLRAKQVVLPSDSVRDAFEKLYEPLLGQWKALKRQRTEVVTLRNELLPLLLNGQASFSSSNKESR